MASDSEFTPTLSAWLVFCPHRGVQHGSATATVTPTWVRHRVAVAARLRELAPYAALLALPGGSLMALLLWVYRRHRNAADGGDVDGL